MMLHFKRAVLVSLLAPFLLIGCASKPQYTGSNPNAERIAKRLAHYRRLRNAPWPQLALAKSLKQGASSPLIPKIRRRLEILGDLPESAQETGQHYGPAMVSAVARFQWRHGLKSNGVINRKTIAALNISPASRWRTMHRNLRRWARFPKAVGREHILVNVASFKLDVMKDGESVMNMRVVAGRPDRQTPVMYSKVRTIVFNPKWNIPRSIVKKDIIPKIIKDPNYLAENDITIFSSWRKNAYEIDPDTIDWQLAQETGTRYRFTQRPGSKNALGRVKFVFMNEHDVYLHDTPQRGLFNKIQRAYSSGCIRLEKPFKLVEYFIQNNPKLDQEKVDQYLSEGKIKYVRMANPIPIYITYITAWVDKNGVSHFREDIYKRDFSSR